MRNLRMVQAARAESPQFEPGEKWHILRRATRLLGPHKKHLVPLLVLVVVTNAALVLPPLLWGQLVAVVEAVFPTDPDVTPLPVSDAVLQIHLYGAGLLLLVVGSSLLAVLRGYFNQLVGQEVTLHLRGRLHEHLQKLSMRFYTQTRTGEILARVTSDANAVQGALTTNMNGTLGNVVALATALVAIAAYDWRFALAALVVPPLWVYPTLRVGDRMRELSLAWRDENAEMTSHLEETMSISGSMVVRTFGRQDLESERFTRRNVRLRDLSLKRFMAGRWFSFSTELFDRVVVGLVYWVGALIAIGGGMPISKVIVLGGLISRVFGPFRALARINTNVIASLALFQRIFEYLDLPVEVEEARDAVDLEHPRGEIRFEDVSFGYAKTGRSVLSNATFEVAPGRMLALVGPSGAGKTTATYLLQRFYDPDRGRVSIDGHDLRTLTLASVSRAVGAVMQETYLFHATVAENIRYGRPEATDEEVARAADLAGLDDVLERLPEGLETVVGERGFRLSGGEKQRVAIARAILKDPPVLVLDEATASLDSRLEREIREATALLAKGRTTVVIAHRLSTVLAADEILVLDRGRIVERGRHPDLLAVGGLYATLYREQFSQEDAA